MATVIKPPQIGSGGVPDPVRDPISAYRYLDGKRQIIEEEAKARPLVRLWDKAMRYIGTVVNEKSVSAEVMLHDTGMGKIELLGSDWLVEFLRTDVRAEEDLHITIDPYPHNRNWRWRWGGKVTNVIVKRNQDGLKSVMLECAENREHWKHLLFGATPFMPPEVQPLKAWILPGNTRTIISVTAFINLARMFWPILALPDNILNPGAWVGQLSGAANLWPLNWPIQMQFINPLFDQSRLSVMMSRWSDAHSVTESLLKDAGCHVRAYTWLTEDEDSPHPELAALVGEQAARPTRNCFRGTERFLTQDGSKSFAETVGTEQMVLGYRGEWTPATIESFGKQEMSRLTVARHGIQKDIYTTAGHRWFKSGKRRMQGGKWSTEVTTLDLRPGDRLTSKFKTSHLHRSHPSAVGIQAGIVFGDGHKAKDSGSTVRLFGEKDSQLLKWFPLSPSTTHELKTGVPYTEVSGLPRYFKDAPSLSESKSYLYGWLAGYFAADGCVDRNGAAMISTASLGTARLIQDVCNVLGIKTGSIRTCRRKGFDGRTESDLHTVGLRTRDLDEDFFLIDEHRVRASARMARDDRGHGDLADWTVVSVEATGEVEEVYCAVVPDGQAFTLDGNILTGNCIVLAVEDDSGVTGITGTALDGAINLIAATGDDFITTLLYEVIGDSNVIDPLTNTPAPPLIRKLLGAAPALPDIVFRDTEYSPIVSSEHAMYRSKAKHIMTGGKSPGWVNQLQTFAIKYALSQISMIFEYAAAGGTDGYQGSVQGPGTSGLEEVYQGQLDDMLLAYIRFTDPIRELRVGEYGYLEHFEQGSGSAYTVSSVMTLRQGHWKTRPYQAFKVQVRNGFPHRLYYDFDLGTRCLFEIDGLLYTDQVTAIKLHYDDKTPKTFDLSIGDDGEQEDPVARVARGVTTIWSAIGVLFGSADLF